MTNYLFIDFAERYSAAVLLGGLFEVLGEATCDFGKQSRPPTVAEIITCLTTAEKWAADGSLNVLLQDADRIVVEDVNPFAVNPKPVLRSQGGFLRACHDVAGVTPQLVTATVWQRYFGYRKVKGRSSKGWAKDLCAEFGYEPKSTGKGTVDLRDSYLGARWMVETL